jgi:hypothetical protein
MTTMAVRISKVLPSGKRKTLVTAVGGDDAKLASEFLEWTFSHFRRELVRVLVSPTGKMPLPDRS